MILVEGVGRLCVGSGWFVSHDWNQAATDVFWVATLARVPGRADNGYQWLSKAAVGGRI